MNTEKSNKPEQYTEAQITDALFMYGVYFVLAVVIAKLLWLFIYPIVAALVAVLGA